MPSRHPHFLDRLCYLWCLRPLCLSFPFSSVAFTGLTVPFPIMVTTASRPLVPLSAHQCIDY